MKILSLFDGISCARVALERAGIPVEAYYASEVDKYAMQISAKNYPDIIQVGDVKEVAKMSYDGFVNNNSLTNPYNLKMYLGNNSFVEKKEIDLLIGGSPCQDLSIAKKNRKGLDGERSGLFWEYVRILKEVEPRYFILENVNSMPKEAKALITETLGVEPIMINAALVSAQNRKRLFWTNIPNVTLPEDRGILLKDILEQDVDLKYCISSNQAHATITENKSSPMTQAMGMGGGHVPYVSNKPKRVIRVLLKDGTEKLKSNTIRTSGRGSGIDDKHNWDTIRIGQIGKGGQDDRIYSPKGKSVGLSALGGGRGAKTGLYMVQTSRGYNKGGIKALDGKTPTLSSSAWEHNNHLVENSQIRKLTPTECMRLQGLPDGYCDGVSNSQQYKMLGNAFNVDVIAHILSSLDKPLPEKE